MPSLVLASEDIALLVKSIVADAEAGGSPAAADGLQRLRSAQHHQPEAAFALLHLVDRMALPRDVGIACLSDIAKSHAEDAEMLSAVGCCLERVRDIDDLNSPPPDAPVFREVIEKLAAMAGLHDGMPDQMQVLRGLATAARMLGRQYDVIAESSYRKLTELAPQDGAQHYNLGLLYKTRGRFVDGMIANQIAVSLVEEPDQSYLWNLGICATGAGDATTARDAWRRLGLTIDIGRFGLPEGDFGQCKVKLAERPLAERTADCDDPGFEETIWIERLSPCHGVVRSVLYRNLGVDFGDVILHDGAPITHHAYGELRIPVFPHLATLRRQNYQMFDFAGTQETPEQLAELSRGLDRDAVIYSHSESMVWLCANCWRSADIDHEHLEKMEAHVVKGRIAAPPDMTPENLLEMIDKAIAGQTGCRIYAPELCLAAGLAARAQIDRRRFDLLTKN
ncbi:tetratricopeptide repeat protein [Bradyrhizobium sp. HKCCYLS2038]|uniref:tetratricopeptide repeat protein n=1 Tax=unclassified Bradyrhizobium TaxID=2631580 RepID=UPI003EB9D7AA